MKTRNANGSLHQLTSKPSFLSQQELSESGEHGNIILTDAEVRNVLTLPPAMKGLSSTNSELNTTTGQNEGGQGDGDGEDEGNHQEDYRSTGHSMGRMGYEDGSFYSSNGHLEYDDGDSERLSSVSIEEKTIPDEDDEDFEISRRGIGGSHTRAVTGSTGKYFNRFYLKLFMLPLVFISIRFWSSLRILLAYFNEAKYANNGFLLVMQAFFDPSQGFFNSILFVFFSKSDRNRLFATFEKSGKSVWEFFCRGRRKCQKTNETNIRLENIVRNQRENSTRIVSPAGEGGRPSVVGGVGVSLPSNLREGLVTRELKNGTANPLVKNGAAAAVVAQQQEKKKTKATPAKKTQRRSDEEDCSEIAIEDLEDEFECNGEDRLSNFSFDSRLDTQSTCTAQTSYQFEV